MPLQVCRRCAVPHCTMPKRRNHPGGVSSFSFPLKDPERCKKWVRAIKNPKYSENTAIEELLKELQNERVCSLHFKPEEFERDELKHHLMGLMGGRGRKPAAVLSTTAVPSVNLDDEPETAEPPPAEKLTQASLPEMDSINTAEVSSTSLEPEVDVVIDQDASPDVPRKFSAAHEANILSLFKRCQTCGCPIYSTDVYYVREKMHVKWDCFGGHAGTWKSLMSFKSVLKADDPANLPDEDVMVPEDSSDGNWDPLEITNSMFSDSDSGTDEIEADDDALCQLCPECGKLILKNMKTAHVCENKIKNYSCNVCGKNFVTEHQLKFHGRVHRESYKHACKFCLKTFKTRPHKLAHEKSHPRVKKALSMSGLPRGVCQDQSPS